MNKQTILQAIKSRGYKLTQTRQYIIELFLSTSAPLAYSEINDYLARRYKRLDKTTIYRELDFLTAQEIIKSLDFGDGKKRYELMDREHHHHLICTGCKEVQDVHFHEGFEEQQKQILAAMNFEITDHTLEFFGRCGKCRTEAG